MAGSSDDETGALQPDSLLGVTVAGKYEVKRILGAGGMGAVYLASQKMLNRAVALKVLRPPADSGVDRELFDEMFLAEAAAAAALKSPHSVTVYDFGRTDKGTLFIAMDYLEGRSVQDTLETDGPMDVGEVVHIGVQVCRALREAHEQGIVHRDLKPANVMLSDRNNDPFFATVLDFGLAGEMPMEEDDDEGVRFLGSPRFAAPEQFRRDVEVDRRSDIYSFGMLLYAMLAGRPPFDGDTGELALAHVTQIPPTLYEVAPDVPAQFSALVHRCVAKEPADRFDDMTEVMRALGEVELPETSHEPEITPHDLADFAEEIGLDEVEPLGGDSDELSLGPAEHGVSEPDAITDETQVLDPGELTDELSEFDDEITEDNLGVVVDEPPQRPPPPRSAREDTPSPTPPWREPEAAPTQRKRGGRVALLLVGLALFGGVALVGAWIGLQFLPGAEGDGKTPADATEEPATEPPLVVEEATAAPELPVEIEDEPATAEEPTEPAPAHDEPPTPRPPEPATAADTSDRAEPADADEPTPYDEPPTPAPEEPPTEEVQVDGYKDDPY